MRVLIRNTVYEFSSACVPGGHDTHLYLGNISDRNHYIVDCKTEEEALYHRQNLLIYGFTDIKNLDFSNDPDWR